MSKAKRNHRTVVNIIAFAFLFAFAVAIRFML